MRGELSLGYKVVGSIWTQFRYKGYVQLKIFTELRENLSFLSVNLAHLVSNISPCSLLYSPRFSGMHSK